MHAHTYTHSSWLLAVLGLTMDPAFPSLFEPGHYTYLLTIPVLHRFQRKRTWVTIAPPCDTDIFEDILPQQKKWLCKVNNHWHISGGDISVEIGAAPLLSNNTMRVSISTAHIYIYIGLALTKAPNPSIYFWKRCKIWNAQEILDC